MLPTRRRPPAPPLLLRPQHRASRWLFQEGVQLLAGELLRHRSHALEAHAPLAVKAGLSPELVADLKASRRPSNMPAQEVAVYDFVTELTTTHAVSDATFARAKELLGEQQVVDLTAVAGIYVTIAMILAMAEEGVPAGKEAPFKPGEP